MSVSVKDSKKMQHVDLTSDSETSASTKGSSAAASAAASGNPSTSTSRKRIIDETLLSPIEARKLQTRRAYNRECASRARKRGKQLVAQLQEEVKELQQDKAELKRSNAVMKAQLQLLEKQNQSLLLKQAMSDRHTAALAATGFMPRQLALGAALSDFRMAGYTSEAAARARLMYAQDL